MELKNRKTGERKVSGIGRDASFTDRDGSRVTLHYPVLTTGNQLLKPGMKFKTPGIVS